MNEAEVVKEEMISSRKDMNREKITRLCSNISFEKRTEILYSSLKVENHDQHFPTSENLLESSLAYTSDLWPKVVELRWARGELSLMPHKARKCMQAWTWPWNYSPHFTPLLV